jgi:hypothetical protein
MKWTSAIAAVAMTLLVAPMAYADSSISGVEGARAKDRQGAWLTRQDRENLRRYGGNDDYGPGYSYGYAPYAYGGGFYGDGYSYGYGPGVSLYLGY